MILYLKQGNFQGFQKNPKPEIVISVAYGTEFVSWITSIVFYLAWLLVFCLYLLSYFTDQKQVTFFHKLFHFYQL